MQHQAALFDSSPADSDRKQVELLAPARSQCQLVLYHVKVGS